MPLTPSSVTYSVATTFRMVLSYFFSGQRLLPCTFVTRRTIGIGFVGGGIPLPQYENGSALAGAG